MYFRKLPTDTMGSLSGFQAGLCRSLIEAKDSLFGAPFPGPVRGPETIFNWAVP